MTGELNIITYQLSWSICCRYHMMNSASFICGAYLRYIQQEYYSVILNDRNERALGGPQRLCILP